MVQEICKFEKTFLQDKHRNFSYYLFLKKFEGKTDIFIKHHNKEVIKHRLVYDYFKEGFHNIDIEI
jgi:hypothetical protein